MISTLVTAPVIEPVTLDEARQHLRVDDHHDDDQYISTLVTVAREWIETFTHRALNTQTWNLFLDRFPTEIRLPKGSLQSVTEAAFTYVDTDGDATQVPTATYTVDTDSTLGRIYLAYNQSWPTIRDQEKAIQVQYVAGYGDAAADVPAPLRQAILIMIGQWYEMREPVITGTIVTKVPWAAESLAYPYRLFSL